MHQHTMALLLEVVSVTHPLDRPSSLLHMITHNNVVYIRDCVMNQTTPVAYTLSDVINLEFGWWDYFQYLVIHYEYSLDIQTTLE